MFVEVVLYKFLASSVTCLQSVAGENLGVIPFYKSDSDIINMAHMLHSYKMDAIGEN